MLLDHCYELGLLLKPSGLKKKLFEEGDPPPPPPVSYFASPWIRPWANMAKTSFFMCPAMSTSSLPSFVNIH